MGVEILRITGDGRYHTIEEIWHIVGGERHSVRARLAEFVKQGRLVRTAQHKFKRKA